MRKHDEYRIGINFDFMSLHQFVGVLEIKILFRLCRYTHLFAGILFTVPSLRRCFKHGLMIGATLSIL